MSKTVSIEGEAASRPTSRRDVEVHSVDFRVDPDGAARVLPRLPANAMFLYAAHPARWTIMAGELVPQVGTIVLMPGVNGCELSRSGRLRWRAAVQHWQERGWTVIKPEHAPNGQGYVNRVQVRGGFHYLDVFTTPHAGTDAVSSDHAGMARWLKSLMNRGLVAEPEVWAVRALAERLRRSAAAKPEEHRELVEVVSRALDDLETDEIASAPVAPTEGVVMPDDGEDEDAVPAAPQRTKRAPKKPDPKE